MPTTTGTRPRAERTTMEFLSELDDVETPSREIDLEADPTLRAAVTAAAAEADARDAPQAAPPALAPELGFDAGALPAQEEQVPQAPDAIEPGGDDRPERLVALPAPEPARSAEEQQQQRRARVVDRIATARDAFRCIGYMGIAEDQRKNVARMLLELETAVGGAEKATVIRDPKAALANATKAQLDAAEKLLGPIEEKLLALDDQVGDLIFEDRILNAKQNKKIIARYGRLLVSRRMPPGPRRNRFEWLATHLLTRTAESGQLVPLPPERARNVLQHLIGGLPRKVRQQEIDEATDYLFEVSKRLDRVRSADELFESGVFADMHGYKVSMREHVLSPEFVYRSVLIGAKLHNMLEQWVASQERLYDKNQLTHEGTPRVQMQRRLAAERDDVDGRLGGKARIAVGPVSEPPAAPPPKRKAAKEKPNPLKQLLERVQLDRQLATAALLLAVIVGSALYVSSAVGVVGEPELRTLPATEAAQLSPLLLGGRVLGTGDEQQLRGYFSGKKWKALEPRKKNEAADALARKLSAAGIPTADIFVGNNLIIVIRSGTLIRAEGAKL